MVHDPEGSNIGVDGVDRCFAGSSDEIGIIRVNDWAYLGLKTSSEKVDPRSLRRPSSLQIQVS